MKLLITYVLKFYTTLLLLCCFSLLSFAQGGNGKVTGKIIDGGTNETLVGVSIIAEGTKLATTSLPDGSYVLSLPAGTYTIIYKYVGYQAKQIADIVVKTGQSTFQNVVLQSASEQLQAVVVKTTVKREGQSSVYSAQKRSAAASDGISQEAIRRTPDNNAAQVLTRVTGVNIQNNRFVVVRGLADQYNQTMVNGVQMTSTQTDRNAFAFDLIPAAVVENIVVNKTATPDMPGSFAGGVVQVNTKDFPDNTFFSVSLQTGYSDATLGKTFYSSKRGPFEWMGFGGTFRNLPKDFPTGNSRNKLYDINPQERYFHLRRLENNMVPLDFGKSSPNSQLQVGFGKAYDLKNNRKFGIVAAFNQRKTELIEDETMLRDPFFQENPGYHPQPDTVQGFGYFSDHTRYTYSSNFGGVLNLAYRFNNNKLTLKNIYSTVFRNAFVNRHSAYIPNFRSSGFGESSGKSLAGLNHFTENSGLLSIVLAGEHRTGKNNETRIDWNVSTSSNQTRLPDNKNYIFGVDSLSPKVYFQTDFDGATGQTVGSSRSWQSNKDRISGASFNLTTALTIGSSKHLLKAGMLYQNRSRNTSGIILPISNFSPTGITLDSVFADKYLTPQYLNDPSFSAAAFDVNSAANYSAGTSLLAAYESLESKLGKYWRVIWGLRMENYQQTVNPGAFNFLEAFHEPNIAISQVASRVRLNLLPSVNVIYSPTDKVNVRAAASRTVIRPDLRDLLPVVRFDFERLSPTEGNATLQSSSVSNFDLKFEYFPSSGEILSLSAFYKSLKNPIEYAEPTLDGYNVSIPVNTGDAYIRGVEMEVRKKIDFITSAPWLENLSVFGNYSLFQSKVIFIDILGTPGIPFFEEHRLTGQANSIINAGMSLQLFKNSFETTLSYNRTDDYVNSLGSSDLAANTANGTKFPLNPHIMLKARDMVDLVASQFVLKRKGQIRLKVSNLLNKPFILYQDLNANGKLDKPYVTVKNSFNNGTGQGNYVSGIDNTVAYTQPQRTFSFSFAYTF